MRFNASRVIATWDPREQTDRHQWKHYLPPLHWREGMTVFTEHIKSYLFHRYVLDEPAVPGGGGGCGRRLLGGAGHGPGGVPAEKPAPAEEGGRGPPHHRLLHLPGTKSSALWAIHKSMNLLCDCDIRRGNARVGIAILKLSRFLSMCKRIKAYLH